VVQLSERYAQPTANVTQAIARELFERRLPHYAALKTFAGLSFLRDVIANGTTPNLDGAELDLDVQGSLTVHARCPGWDATPTADEAKTGFVDLTVGVDASRVQRAFTGRATGCRFIAKNRGESANVSVSMQLQVDLGHSLGLGEPVPSILVRLSELSTQLSGAAIELDIDADALGDALSLRIGGEDLIETLVELEPLDLGQQGTILLGLRDDGSVAVRGRDSAWICSSTRSILCARSD
jgi:hypothetical protein